MILYINTQDKNLVEVSLKKGSKIVASLSEQNEYGSQVLLPLIIKLLKTENCSPRSAGEAGELKTLEGIEVSTGSGSFVGLRVGVSVANALGFALGIPVNGKKFEVDIDYK